MKAGSLQRRKPIRKVLLIVATVGALFAGSTVANAQNVLTLHCKANHFAQVDPIVSFGQTVSAHNHQFFGSTAVTATSTADDLVGTSTTCKTAGDTAGYWMPQAIWTFQDGRVVALPAAGTLGEYWQRPNGVRVVAPPHGMLFVAGDSHATSPAANPNLSWSCGNGAESAMPRDCTGSTGGSKDVTAVLRFAECWDGSTAFDAPAGIAPSHFAYPNGNSCPAGFGTRLSRLTMHNHFLDPRTGKVMVNPYRTDGVLGLSFTSGPFYTFHGDFENGWNQSRLVSLIDGCVNRLFACPTHA